jgi:hypothetical protein
MRRRKKLWFSAAAAVIALICAELVLRAAGFAAPTWYRPDPLVGWTLRPELRDVNTAGQRDREHMLAKADDVYRIAVLGDEYSEARQLALADTWWARLGHKLDECAFQPRKRIEVLNFAVGGYGTAQQYVQLETSVMRYQPDLVLLQFNNADDVQNNSFILEPQKHRPFFMLDAKGRLAIDESFAVSEGFRRRASLKYEAWRKLGDRWRIVQLANAVADMDLVSNAYAGPDLGTGVAPRDPTWEEAWRVTEALIAKGQEFTGRNGARFALVIVPARRQLLNTNDSYAEKRLQSFAARRGIPAIALEGEMQRRGSVEALFDEKEGHQAAAEIIAQRLCEQ